VDARTARRLGPASTEGTSIVVLTFNSRSTIRDCLAGVLETMDERDELILVDNASTDGTQTELRRLSAGDERVRTILLEQNLGFSAGCNVGLGQSRGQTLALLNPDTVVFPGWLEALRRRLDDPLVGATGPLSDYVSGDQFVGHHLPRNRRSGLSREELSLLVQRLHQGRSLETRLLIGFCVMFRREVLHRVGLLDEDLFLGSEDLEISWRLRTHGYRLLAALDVFVHHEGGASFASARPAQVRRLLGQSTEALRRKLKAAYRPRPVPPSRDLFGCDILNG
jgi:O-antigen biosynthesis protein